MKITQETALKMAQGMRLSNWNRLQELDHCFICKKFKEPLYVPMEGGDGEKILNGKYLFHLFSTHALPPGFVVDMIADKIYNNEEDKKKMRNLYEFYDNY